MRLQIPVCFRNNAQTHCYLAMRDGTYTPPPRPYYPYRSVCYSLSLFLFLHCHQIRTHGRTDHLVTIATGIEHPIASSAFTHCLTDTHTQMPLVLKEFLNILPTSMQQNINQPVVLVLSRVVLLVVK